MRFSVDVPIDENDFTYEQFQHSLGVAVKSVEEYAPKLRAILDGKITCQELVKEEASGALGSMPQLLRKLLEALEERHRRDRDQDDDDPLTEV